MTYARWHIVAGSFVCLVLGALTVAHFTDPAEASLRGEEFWVGRINSTGIAEALEEFKAHNMRVTPSKRHNGAHEFGGALFAAKDLAGVTGCTNDFANGCYHEFFGRTVASHGLGVVGELANHCAAEDSREEILPCEHGIGHGLVTLLGYDTGGLTKSLAICADLESTDPVRGCSGGVFMEFNFRDAQAGTAPSRTYTGNMTYPCTVVSSNEKDACYFWQAQWWRQIPFGELEPHEAFIRIAERCRALDAQLLRQSCFAGLGNFLGPDVEFNLNKAAKECDAVTEAIEETLYCRMRVFRGASSIIPEGEWLNICAGLRSDARKFCESYVNDEEPSTFINSKTGVETTINHELFIGPKR